MSEEAKTLTEGERVYVAIPEFARIRDDILYGDVWKQPELGKRDRSLVTCAILAALGRTNELAHHAKAAHANGVTEDELRGLAVHVAL